MNDLNMRKEELDVIIDFGNKVEELMNNDLFKEVIQDDFIESYTDKLATKIENANTAVQAQIWAEIKARSVLDTFLKQALRDRDNATDEKNNINQLEESEEASSFRGAEESQEDRTVSFT